MTRRYPSAVSALLLVGLAVLARTGGRSDPSPGRSTRSVASTVFLSPGETGNCTRGDPCGDLNAALAKAGNGGVVEVGSGRFADQTLHRSAVLDRHTKSITVQPAPGARPIFGQIKTSASHVEYKDLAVAGVFYLTSGAAHTQIDGAHLYGGKATLIIRASHVVVEHSLIEDGRALDGINVASNPRNTDITIRQNTVRDLSGGTTGQQHPDCIQLFDTSHVTIERNSLYDCYNSAITFSPGARLGIDHILVEGNFLQGCMPDRQRCGAGGSVMDLRHHVRSTEVIHNTFGKGSLRLPRNAGVTATANIVGYLSVAPCRTALSHSLIIRYTTFSCHSLVPGAAAGNWAARVSFVDAHDNNLRPVTSPAENPSSGAAGIPAGAGYFGAMSKGTVGAA